MGEHNDSVASGSTSEGKDRAVKITAVVCAVILIVLVAVMAFRPDRTAGPMGINSDVLGPDKETMAEYQQRADRTLSFEDSDHHWALVSFQKGLDAAAAAAPFSGMDVRVGSVLIGPGVVQGIPSPTPSNSLEQIFQTEVDRAQAASQLPEAPTIPGVVVWATMPQLKEIRSKTYAVEALPSDAVWGRIGVRNPPTAADGQEKDAGQEGTTAQEENRDEGSPVQGDSSAVPSTNAAS